MLITIDQCAKAVTTLPVTSQFYKMAKEPGLYSRTFCKRTQNVNLTCYGHCKERLFSTFYVQIESLYQVLLSSNFQFLISCSNYTEMDKVKFLI